METGKQARALELSLKFDPLAEVERICRFIRGEVERRSVRGVVIGLSGGMDSSVCAYLCSRCLPADQIHLLTLPERDSSSAPYHHAQAVARALNLPLEERNLSDFFSQIGLYNHVSSDLAKDRPHLERSIRILRWLSGSPALFPWVQQYAYGQRKGLLARFMRRWLWTYAGKSSVFVLGKIRARMLVLGVKALQLDCLLVCTTDRSEWSIGFYDPHGDGVGDIAPLRHLYKTQIRELAWALGVADEIIRQPSSGDLAAGLPNETAIGLHYEQLDRVLAGLALGMEEEDVAAGSGVGRSMVKAIRGACQLADERRRMPAALAVREQDVPAPLEI
jgi:NAD+ synthase